jgi:hypothetical protein
MLRQLRRRLAGDRGQRHVDDPLEIRTLRMLRERPRLDELIMVLSPRREGGDPRSDENSMPTRK